MQEQIEKLLLAIEYLDFGSKIFGRHKVVIINQLRGILEGKRIKYKSLEKNLGVLKKIFLSIGYNGIELADDIDYILQELR